MLLPMAREQDMIPSFQRGFLQLRGAEFPPWHPPALPAVLHEPLVWKGMLPLP